MNKQRAKEIQIAVERELEGLAARLGVAIKLKGGTFGPSHVLLRLEVAEISESGEVQSSEALTFTRYAALYGMRPEWLGQTYRAHGDVMYRVTGLVPSRRKYPVTVVNVRTGAPLKTTEVAVIAGFAREEARNKT